MRRHYHPALHDSHYQDNNNYYRCGIFMLRTWVSIVLVLPLYIMITLSGVSMYDLWIETQQVSSLQFCNIQTTNGNQYLWDTARSISNKIFSYKKPQSHVCHIINSFLPFCPFLFVFCLVLVLQDSFLSNSSI